jgi:8-oxo-dGTP diphosphatase
MYQYKYPHPAVTTDCVVFGFDGTSMKVLLVERGGEPFKGQLALPGGFLNMDETADECAVRELEEETGLKNIFVEQFHTFSGVERDPRERVLSVAYYALAPTLEVHGGDDAASAQWYDLQEIPQLAFDHLQILQMALRCLKERIHFKPIGFELLPEVFKMTQLQNLYEAILEVKFDRRNFYKKMMSLELLEMADPAQDTSNRRVPILYRFNRERYEELKTKGFRLEF